MAIIYRHIRNDIKQPFYIGKSKDLYRPYRKDGRNRLWNQIVSETDYEVEILFYDLSDSEANEKEKELIKLYGKMPNGYLCNMADGGLGSLGCSRDDDFKIRNSNIHKNKVLSDETKIKMSIAKKGKKLSESHRLNIKKATKGRVFTEEHKNKIGLANKSVKHGNWNGHIYKYDKNGNLIAVFENLNDAMISTGANFRDISKVCSYYNFLEGKGDYKYKKNHKTANGFIFKRLLVN